LDKDAPNPVLVERPLGNTGFTPRTLNTAVAHALGVALSSPPEERLPFTYVQLHDVVKALKHEGVAMPEGFTPEMEAAIGLAGSRETSRVLQGSGECEDVLETGLRLSCSRVLQEIGLRLDHAAFTHALEASATAATSGDETVLPPWVTAQTMSQLSAALDSQQYFPPSTTPPKFLLYSSHDTSLIPIMASLGIWDGHWPAFGSTLGFELLAVPTSSAGQGGETPGPSSSSSSSTPPPTPGEGNGGPSSTTPPPDSSDDRERSEEGAIEASPLLPFFDAPTSARLEALLETYIVSVQSLNALRGEEEEKKKKDDDSPAAVTSPPGEEVAALVRAREDSLREISAIMDRVLGGNGGGGEKESIPAHGGLNDGTPPSEPPTPTEIKDWEVSLGLVAQEALGGAVGVNQNATTTAAVVEANREAASLLAAQTAATAAVEASNSAILSALEASAARALVVESGNALAQAKSALASVAESVAAASASAAAAQSSAQSSASAASALVEHAGLASAVAEARGHALSAVKAAAEAAVLAQADTAVLIAELESFRAKSGAEASAAASAREEMRRRVAVEKEELEASLSVARDSASSLLEIARAGVEEGLKALLEREREAREAAEVVLRELNAELGEAVAWVEGRRAAAVAKAEESEARALDARLAAAAAIAASERDIVAAKERCLLETRAVTAEAYATAAKAVEATREAIEEALMTRSLASSVIETAREEVAAARASASSAAAEAKERVEAETAAAVAAVEAVQALARTQLEEAEREAVAIKTRLAQLRRVRETTLFVATPPPTPSSSSSSQENAKEEGGPPLWEEIGKAAAAFLVKDHRPPSPPPSSEDKSVVKIPPGPGGAGKATTIGRTPPPAKTYGEAEARIVTELEADKAALAAAVGERLRSEAIPRVLSSWGVKDSQRARAQAARYIDTWGYEEALRRAASATNVANAAFGSSSSSSKMEKKNGEEGYMGLLDSQGVLRRDAKPVERPQGPPPKSSPPPPPLPSNDSYTAHLKVQAILQGLPIPSDDDSDKHEEKPVSPPPVDPSSPESTSPLSPQELAYVGKVASGTVASQPYIPWIDPNLLQPPPPPSPTPVSTHTPTTPSGEKGYMASLANFAARTSQAILSAAAAAATAASAPSSHLPLVPGSEKGKEETGETSPHPFPLSPALMTPSEAKILKTSPFRAGASPDEAYLSTGARLLPHTPSSYGQQPTQEHTAAASEMGTDAAYTAALLGKKSPAASATAYSPITTMGGGSGGAACSPPYHYFVRVLYNGVPMRVLKAPPPRDDTPPAADELADSSTLIPLPIFRLLLARRISRDYLGECGGGSPVGAAGDSGGETPHANTVSWPTAAVLPTLTHKLACSIGLKGLHAVSPASMLSLADSTAEA